MRRVFAWGLVLAGMVACGGDSTDPRPPAPVPGTLTVTLESPNVDAAMIVEVTGPGTMTGVASTLPGVTLYSRPHDTVVRAALFGPLRAGAVFTFSVPDVAAAAEYAARVVEAADSTNAVRSSVGAYRLVVAP